MAVLTWDGTVDRIYESGLDKGVLYVADGTGIPWNGLTAVDEKFAASISNPLYFDGIKYHEIVSISDYAATLKAITYPKEFLEFEGVQEVEAGFLVTAQQSKTFGLSYRTKIGNPYNADLGYKIHVVCNVSAIPVQRAYHTMTLDADAIEFEWSLTAIPAPVPGFRPTAHLIFDSSRVAPAIYTALQNILYGTAGTAAYLPTFTELLALIDLT